MPELRGSDAGHFALALLLSVAGLVAGALTWLPGASVLPRYTVAVVVIGVTLVSVTAAARAVGAAGRWKAAGESWGAACRAALQFLPWWAKAGYVVVIGVAALGLGTTGYASTAPKADRTGYYTTRWDAETQRRVRQPLTRAAYDRALKQHQRVFTLGPAGVCALSSVLVLSAAVGPARSRTPQAPAPTSRTAGQPSGPLGCRLACCTPAPPAESRRPHQDPYRGPPLRAPWWLDPRALVASLAVPLWLASGVLGLLGWSWWQRALGAILGLAGLLFLLRAAVDPAGGRRDAGRR